MNAETVMNSAAERSAVYRVLGQAFTYGGATNGPFSISGADYNDAFDPSVTEGACSLRERAYTEEDQSSLFEELMRFYEMFGLKRGENAEMPDHLGVELEFMHFLTHLENEVADRAEELASVRNAQRDFLVRHVARLVHGVRSGMKTGSPQCRQLVATACDFIDAELALARQHAESCSALTPTERKPS